MKSKHGTHRELQGCQPACSVQESVVRNEGMQRPDHEGPCILASEFKFIILSLMGLNAERWTVPLQEF